MSNCKKMPYFEGLQDETIKQGSVFDLTEGVRAFDGDDQEITYTYSPTNDEFDTCAVGSYTIQYHASQTADKMLPNMCIPGGLALTTPRYCDDYESTTAKRIIKIIRASNPQILGIPHVTIAKNATLDVLNGVSAVDDNGNPIADISYSGTLDKQVSGDIASITDGQSVVPVKSLKVTLEPIQDLHGYDKPWAGGAGKNILNVGSRVSQTTAGVTYTSDDNYVILNGTKNGGGYADLSTLTLALDVGTYYAKAFEISGTQNPSTAAGLYVYDGSTNLTASSIIGTERQFTLSEAKTVRFRFGIFTDGVVYTNWKIGIVISKTSGIDKFYPYSNICPISGRTECVTEVCGVNVWDEEWEVYNNSYVVSKNYIPVVGGETYYWSCSAKPSNGLRYYDADKNLIKTDYSVPSTNLIVMPSNCRYIIFRLSSSYGTTYNHDISINYPSTDHDYHAYQGTTYTTDLGRTVYGGTLDVVSGELVVDRAMVDLSTLSWSGSSGIKLSTGIANVVKAPSANNIPANIVAEKYATSAVAPISANDGKIGIETTGRIQCGSSETPSGMLCYELATPQTYQLDPQTISLLHGNNNVWSDGEVTMVYSLEIPTDGEVSYPLEGEYEITYSATDKCGNVGEAIRQITVE